MLTLKAIRANTIEDKANHIALLSVFIFGIAGLIFALCVVLYYFGIWIILFFPLLIFGLGLSFYVILILVRQANCRNDKAVWDDKMNKMRLELSYGNMAVDREEIVRAVLFEIKDRTGEKGYRSEPVLGLELKNNRKFVLVDAGKGDDFSEFINAMVNSGILIVEEKEGATPDLSYFLKKYPRSCKEISIDEIKGTTEEEKSQYILKHFSFQTDRTPLAMIVILFLITFIPAAILTFNSERMFLGYLVIWIFVLLGVILHKDHPDLLLTSKGLLFADVSLTNGEVRKRSFIRYEGIVGISVDGKEGTRITISTKDGRKYKVDATPLYTIRLVERVLYQLDPDPQMRRLALDDVIFGDGWTRPASPRS